MNRLKVAIVHPRLREGGGSEARALWCTEALKEEYEVTLISMGEINLSVLNNCYGTNINRNDINLMPLSLPRVIKHKFDSLRNFSLARYCKRNSDKYDLMISTYNIMDFGKRGIQFIADFSFDDHLRRTFDRVPEGLLGIFHQKSPLRKLYLRFGEFFAGASSDGWRENLTIANSEWSSNIFKDRFGIEAKTIYPPVNAEYPNVPWEKRGNGFVCLGRLVPEKRIDRIIEILKQVKQKLPDIHLHIIGRVEDPGYFQKLKKICRGSEDWIFLERGLYGRKKLEMITRHKYGIHGRPVEPFGIAAAEMVKAGCLVWVPDRGGQVEIVGHSDLVYSEHDAKEKIIRIVKEKKQQEKLLSHLSIHSLKFSQQIFIDSIKELVRNFFLKYSKEKTASVKDHVPLVSVIIPTFNRSRLLLRSINSVLKQTYKNFELIVVDDASNDDTEDVVRSIKDSRISYIRHAENQGAAAARNTGIKRAKASYIAFQDSDDEWMPDKLEKQIHEIMNTSSEIGAVYCGFYRDNRGKRIFIPSKKIEQKDGDLYELLIQGHYLIGTPSVLVKKTVFDKIGLFNEVYPALEEWDLWLRMARVYKFKFLNEPLLISYQTPGSLSVDRRLFLKGYELILSGHRKELENNRIALSNLYTEIANQHCHMGNVRVGRKYFLSSLRIKPKSMRNLFGYFFSLFGPGVYRNLVYLKNKLGNFSS